MHYEGIVTGHNLKLCCFTLDCKLIVHAGLKFQNEAKRIKIPLLNEKITIYDGKLYAKRNFILNESSKIECESFCDRKQTLECNNVLNLIRMYKWTPKDLIKLTELLNQLKTNKFCSDILEKNNISYEDLLFELFPFINTVPNSCLKFPDDFKPESNAKRIEPLRYWNFGIHSNPTQEQLIGYLQISLKLGFVVLSNKNFSLVCSIGYDSSEPFSKQISNCLNQIVLIRKYQMISETFKSSGTFDYVFFNIKDLDVLNLNYKTVETNVRNKSEMSCSCLLLKIMHRGSIDSKFRCLCHCTINNQPCLLRLNQTYTNLYQTINGQDSYIFNANNEEFLTKLNDTRGDSSINIFGLNPKLQLYTMPENAELIQLEYEPEQFLTVSEAVTLLKNNHKKLITFEGVITRKRFLEPLPSRVHHRAEKNKNVAFGTQGPQVHQIILKNSNYETESEHLAYVYLYNWDTLQCPLGLVPDMKVIVRYVYPQNGRYFKPNFLTRIETVSYVPVISFNTCYELLGNENWGPMFHLGKGNQIPTDALCWGRTEVIRLTFLSIEHSCTSCKQRVYSKYDTCCPEQSVRLNIMVVLNVKDEAGESDVITRDYNVLKVLLNITELEWVHWTRTFSIVNHFKYRCKSILYERKFRSEEENDSNDEYNSDYEYEVNRLYCPEEQQHPLIKAMFLYFNVWNKAIIHNFDLKCRKIDKNRKDRNDNPKWYCLEARKTNRSIKHLFDK